MFSVRKRNSMLKSSRSNKQEKDSLQRAFHERRTSLRDHRAAMPPSLVPRRPCFNKKILVFFALLPVACYAIHYLSLVVYKPDPIWWQYMNFAQQICDQSVGNSSGTGPTGRCGCIPYGLSMY